MNPNRRRKLVRRAGGVVLVAMLPALFVSSVRAQYRGELEVQGVVMPVTVRTSSGRVVSDLSPSRFSLFIDGLEYPIQDLVLESDLPLSLGFILDTSGSMAGRKFAACNDLIMAFLEQRRPVDQIALWTFGSGRVLERFPFNMGWYLLPRVLESIKPWSTTALYDMILRVPEVMERAEHPRRAVILLTDGVDNASEIGHERATDIARQLKTPVYVLGVEPPPSPPGETGPSYEEVLRIIASSSGGHYQRVPLVEDMPGVVRQLLHELSSRYIITFSTSGVGVSRWRSIEVKVEGYEVTARSGYEGTLP